MIAYTEAVLDRFDWAHGVASEQHIPEPKHGQPTVRPPSPQKVRAPTA
jgi:hypothetical protein